MNPADSMTHAGLAERPTLVLLAEDDQLIGEAVREALTSAGFEVVRVQDGTVAIEALDSRGSEFEVLVTDIAIGPGPDGWTVARHARTRHPGIAVIYITGESASQWIAQAVPGSMLVQKPFEGGEIVISARALLAAGSPDAVISENIAREISAAVRRSRLRDRTGRTLSGPVFSLRDGEVWASWNERDSEVRMGDLSEVIEMMRDFVRQTEFAEQLLKRLGTDARSAPRAP